MYNKCVCSFYTYEHTKSFQCQVFPIRYFRIAYYQKRYNGYANEKSYANSLGIVTNDKKSLLCTFPQNFQSSNKHCDLHEVAETSIS
jgi:hypothetical protein